MDPIEALKQIQLSLAAAAGSDDIDVIEEHVARAQAIVDMALPAARAARAAAEPD